MQWVCSAPRPQTGRDSGVLRQASMTGRLNPQAGLWPATYRALLGLITAAGLSLSEALPLRDIDVDLKSAEVGRSFVYVARGSQAENHLACAVSSDTSPGC